MNLKLKKRLAASFAVLLILASVVVAQRIKKHGALIDVTRAGAITITPASGQGITLGAGVNITGNTTTVGTLRIGSTGTSLTRITVYTASLSPAEVAANTCAEELFTVTGINASDKVIVNKPTAQAGLGIGGVRASGTNQVGINFCNTSASPIVPTPSQTYSFIAIR
jgi:uncharacterized protein YraI